MLGVYSSGQGPMTKRASDAGQGNLGVLGMGQHGIVFVHGVKFNVWWLSARGLASFQVASIVDKAMGGDLG